MKNQEEKALAVSDVQEGATISSPEEAGKWHPSDDPPPKEHFQYVQTSGSNVDKPFKLNFPRSTLFTSFKLKISNPAVVASNIRMSSHASSNKNFNARRKGRRR